MLSPRLTGLMLPSLLAGGATVYLACPRQLSPIPQSVLDARRENTTAAAQADDFLDLDDETERLPSFQDRYGRTAQPFDRTFTRDDLLS
ncbi:hypothetical protein [Saccharothrix sp.]|uniref:hypothetical protein n=1 Tax=Saccharothrix sp. TaxID=1873460 RepID=UPI0028114B6F|nr:hypothetical protein [Saccharothrix sp.]